MKEVVIMITIKNSPKLSGCLACNNTTNDLKDIKLGQSVVVTLCKKCREELIEQFKAE